MKSLFNNFLFEPIYNALVFLVSVLPGEDVGLAVIILTIFIKLLLFPLAHKSSKIQRKMREIEPEMTGIKEKHKENRQKQAQLMMDLYKKHGINPFSGFLPLFIQLPVIFALYFVFLKDLSPDPSTLYSFISFPSQANFNFLGYIDLHSKSAYLAIVAAITQYFQIQLSTPIPTQIKDRKLSLQEEFVRNMSLQIRYIFPVMVLFISYSLSSVIALYWATSNVFSIAHELFVKRKADKILSKFNK